MGVFVHILLTPEGVDALRTGRGEPPGSGLFRTLQELDVELTPMHPGVRDETLERYYVAEIEGDALAQRIAERLFGEDGVEAAYVKPPQGPPSDEPPNSDVPPM